MCVCVCACYRACMMLVYVCPYTHTHTYMLTQTQSSTDHPWNSTPYNKICTVFVQQAFWWVLFGAYCPSCKKTLVDWHWIHAHWRQRGKALCGVFVYVCELVWECMYTVYRKKDILTWYIDSAKCPVFLLGVVLKENLAICTSGGGREAETQVLAALSLNEP